MSKKEQNNLKQDDGKKKENGEQGNEVKKTDKEYQAEIDKWKTKYYEVFADIANLRNSIEKERINVFKYRLSGFISEIIEVLDAFDMALNYKDDKDEKIRNFLLGFNMIHEKLLKILVNENVHEIKPNKGDIFDSSVMKVDETIFKEGKENDNKIIEVKFKGYKLADRLIRPAIVTVSVNKKDKNINESKK